MPLAPFSPAAFAARILPVRARPRLRRMREPLARTPDLRNGRLTAAGSAFSARVGRVDGAPSAAGVGDPISGTQRSAGITADRLPAARHAGWSESRRPTRAER